jgi:hypothetical protein
VDLVRVKENDINGFKSGDTGTKKKSSSLAEEDLFIRRFLHFLDFNRDSLD